MCLVSDDGCGEARAMPRSIQIAHCAGMSQRRIPAIWRRNQRRRADRPQVRNSLLFSERFNPQAYEEVMTCMKQLTHSTALILSLSSHRPSMPKGR